MNRRILSLYYIISIVFLLFILIFTAYRLKIILDRNGTEAKKLLEELRVTALSIYLVEGTFESEYFRTTLRSRFDAAGRLRLLAIYSRSNGILYLIAADRRYLAEAPGTATAASAWQGKPDYTLRPLYESLLSLPFSPGMGRDLYIDGIFRDLSREELYPLLRELFTILLVYLLVTTVLVLVAASSGRRKYAAARSLPRSARVSYREEVLAPGEPQSESPGRRADSPTGLFSPQTGLCWSQHLAQRLDSELERAASADQDLSLLLAGSPLLESRDFERLGKMVAQHFPLRDLTFEHDSCSVAVILPDKDLDRALKEAKGFQRKVLAAAWSSAPGLAMGLSARNGRIISASRLLMEAEHSLKQAEEAGGDRIVAFRADPQKYRNRLAGRGPRP